MGDRKVSHLNGARIMRDLLAAEENVSASQNIEENARANVNIAARSGAIERYRRRFELFEDFSMRFGLFVIGALAGFAFGIWFGVYLTENGMTHVKF
jgi:hypothetical protein